MEDFSISIGLYFEVKNSDLFGGVGSIGYSSTIVGVKAKSINYDVLSGYAKCQKKEIAKMCKCSEEDVRIISKDEYDANTEDDEADYEEDDWLD